MYSRWWVLVHYFSVCIFFSALSVSRIHFNLYHFSFVCFCVCFFPISSFHFPNLSIILRLHVIHLSAMLVNTLNLFRYLCDFLAFFFFLTQPNILNPIGMAHGFAKSSRFWIIHNTFKSVWKYQAMSIMYTLQIWFSIQYHIHWHIVFFLMILNFKTLTQASLCRLAKNSSNSILNKQFELSTSATQLRSRNKV